MATPPPSEPPAEPPPTRRRWDWRHALRWFAAEFLVVVSGVLVALALNAWWGSQQDRDREAAYLHQLLEDTRENERRLDEAIAEDSVSTLAAGRAVAALHGIGPAPPADSLVRWAGLAGRASDLRPLVGTYRALLNTGDLRLVRDDSLQADLAAYATSLESETARLQQLRGVTLETIRPFAQALPFMREVFLGDIRMETVDVEALRADADAAAVMFTVQATHVNRLSGLRRLRDETRALRRALEGHPALRDAGR